MALSTRYEHHIKDYQHGYNCQKIQTGKRRSYLKRSLARKCNISTIAWNIPWGWGNSMSVKLHQFLRRGQHWLNLFNLLNRPSIISWGPWWIISSVHCMFSFQRNYFYESLMMHHRLCIIDRSPNKNGVIDRSRTTKWIGWIRKQVNKEEKALL